MNRFADFFRSLPASLIALASTLFIVMGVGMGLAIIVATSAIKGGELYSREVCLSKECVDLLMKQIEPALGIAKATLDLGVAIATIGGIFVALLNYLSSANNAALTNHIEHLKVFIEYVEAELQKRDRLSRSNFDMLLFYGKIFGQSRAGKTTVSNDFLKFLVGLNGIIEESNERCSVGTPGGFSYNNHQKKVRDHMIGIGITIYTAPRNDYFEMEGELFSLLHRVSQSFCPPGMLPEMARRNYT